MSHRQVLRKFPAVNGVGIDRQPVSLPGHFATEWCVALVVVSEPSPNVLQQAQLASWIPLVRSLDGAFAGFATYHLAATDGSPADALAWWARYGAHGEMPTPSATVIVEKAELVRALRFPSDENVHVLLVNRAGELGFVGEGFCAIETGKALANEIDRHCRRTVPAIRDNFLP